MAHQSTVGPNWRNRACRKGYGLLTERVGRRPEGTVVVVTGHSGRVSSPVARMSWQLRLVVAAVVCAGGAAVLVTLGSPGAHPGRYVLVVLAVWLACAVAWWLALAGPAPSGRGRRRALLLLLAGAVACQLPGLTQPPLTSTDAYRYVWDGRVQLSGTSPYRYAPGDDALADLRDPVLFPGLAPGEPSGLDTVRPLPDDPAALRGVTRNDDRTAINRPQVPTIYPPVAQAWFAVVAALTPWAAGTLGLQLGSAMLAVGTTALLAWMLVRTGQDPRWAALWGWSPLVAIETGNGAHVDVLATVLLVGSLAVLAARPGLRGRVCGGVLLGLAVATKLWPLLLLPALTALRRGRHEAVVPLSAVATSVATYLPHLLTAGSLVLGFLPAYLVEEGYDDGRSRFGAIALLPLPVEARWPIAATVAVLAAAIAFWTADPRRPWDGACWLLGTALLVATPAYPWYTLPLVALAVLARRPEWLAVAVAATSGYVLHGDLIATRWGWTLAAVVVVGVALGRRYGRRCGRRSGRRWGCRRGPPGRRITCVGEHVGLVRRSPTSATLPVVGPRWQGIDQWPAAAPRSAGSAGPADLSRRPE